MRVQCGVSKVITFSHHVRPQLQASAVDPAFESADGAAGLFGGSFVWDFIQGDHEQCFPLIGREALQRPGQFAQSGTIFVGSGNRLLWHILHIGKLAFIANTADEVVDHDPMHPGGEISAGHKTVLGQQSLGCDVLCKIIGGRSVSCQGECPDAHFRKKADELLIEVVGHACLSLST
jgi:hypothetical protein